jgi:hypothetical protein
MELPMEVSNAEVLGPVDWLVVEFPADKANFSGEMSRELLGLVERELVRILDLVFIRKNEDGSIDIDELSDVPEDAVGDLLAHEASLALLLAEEDIVAVGEALAPDSIAAVLVYENTWAGPFAASIRRAGGQLIDSGRIPTQALLAAVEAEDPEAVKEGV